MAGVQSHTTKCYLARRPHQVKEKLVFSKRLFGTVIFKTPEILAGVRGDSPPSLSEGSMRPESTGIRGRGIKLQGADGSLMGSVTPGLAYSLRWPHQPQIQAVIAACRTNMVAELSVDPRWVAARCYACRCSVWDVVP